MKLLEMLTPREVEKVKVFNDLTTHNSAHISFALPKELVSISRELIFDVLLRLPNASNDTWIKIEDPLIHLEGITGSLFVNNLEFANTVYGVKIRIKARVAKDQKASWSSFQEVTFKTRSRTPERLPQTCANCYNVMDNNKIVVYWMEVPKLYQNADNFSYSINGYNDMGDEIINTRTLNASMNLPNNLKTTVLTLQLFSANNKGISKTFNELVVPISKNITNERALRIRKEIVNNKYKVSWRLLHPIDVESFTIFWCHQRNELPNQCDSSINFQEIPANIFEFTKKASKSLQFGVAANFENVSFSRGFEWAECTAAKANGKGK
jgi:hypothetical protein